jgi:hypothetical protein
MCEVSKVGKPTENQQILHSFIIALAKIPRGDRHAAIGNIVELAHDASCDCKIQHFCVKQLLAFSFLCGHGGLVCFSGTVFSLFVKGATRIKICS